MQFNKLHAIYLNNIQFKQIACNLINYTQFNRQPA